MTFDEVKKCIVDFKVQNIKVVDINGKKIMEFTQEHSPENLVSKLESYLTTLQSYGRLNFICANETQYKQNWKDCYNWTVVFGGSITPTIIPEQPKQQIGYVSQNEAALMAQVQTMQLQMQFFEKIKELEAKLNAPKENDYERLIDKYFPLIAAKLGITFDAESMNQMMGMYQLQNAMKGNANPMVQQNNSNNGINGIKHEPTIHQTEEEKQVEQEIVNEMLALSQKTSDQNILALLKGLNAQPGYIDMALNFIKPKK